jgi:signal transduction histidine kinase
MLVAINSKLEQMIKDRTKQIHDLIERKNDFINQLGHDLKNPLNPLINLTPVLEEKVMDEEGKELISILKRNIEYMRQLIIRTIALAKLNSPTVQFNFERCNLIEEIKTIVENNAFHFDENGICVSTMFNAEPHINVDKLRFNELLVNILDNAVKYSPNGGTVTVQVDDIENRYAKITITDQGRGMSEEQLTLIFEDFYRVKQTENTFQSSGLGMSICKRIVEKHGGTIRCQSPGLGQGSSVIITLPYVQPFKDSSYYMETDKIEKLVHTFKNM